MTTPSPVFRLDTFVVPEGTRDTLLDILRATATVLADQPGLIRYQILERADGPGQINLVTLAEWQDISFIAPARAAVARRHAAMPVPPPEVLRREGIEMVPGLFRPV